MEELVKIDADKKADIENKLKVAQTELDAFNKELEKKVYGYKIGDAMVLLVEFVDNQASWNYLESLGVSKLSKKIHSIAREGFKNGTIYLEALEVDGLHYFMTKHSGTGVQSAEYFIKIARPLNDTISVLKADRDKLMSLERKVAAYSNGIEIEETQKEDAGSSQETV